MDIDLVSQNLLSAKASKLESREKNIENRALKEKELKDACAGFEAILMHSMLKSMRQSLPGDAVFAESHGMNMYKSMYDQYLAEELSATERGSSLGVKEFLYNSLKDSIK